MDYSPSEVITFLTAVVAALFLITAVTAFLRGKGENL